MKHIEIFRKWKQWECWLKHSVVIFFPLTGHDAICSVTSLTKKANLRVWIQSSPLFEKRYLSLSYLSRQKKGLWLFPSIVRFISRKKDTKVRDQWLMDPGLPLILIPPQICPADAITHEKDPPYVIRLWSAEVNGPFWIPGAPVSDIQTISPWCFKPRGRILLTSVLLSAGWENNVYCMRGWAY